MTVKSAQEWSGVAICLDATGALSTPSVGPAGALYVNGVVNGASVTISGSNPYRWTVTLPSLTASDCVSMYLTATISSIATATIAAEDVADTALASEVKVDTTAILLDTGTNGVVLANSAITAAKISASALTNAKFATAAITGNILGASLISASNIAGSALDATVFAGSVIGSEVFSLTAASQVWNAAVRSLSDKANFTIAANGIAVGSIAASAIAASNIGGSAFNATVFASTVDAATADAVWNEARSGHTTAGTYGKVSEWTSAIAGSGATTTTITVNDGTNSLDGVEVWITSDAGGSNVIAGTLSTDTNGQCTFYLDAGTVYVWQQLAGYNFTNPQTLVVS